MVGVYALNEPYRIKVKEYCCFLQKAWVKQRDGQIKQSITKTIEYLTQINRLKTIKITLKKKTLH